MRRHSRYWTAAATVVTTLCGGCQDELGPERFATARVSGTIVLGGRPVEKGWVEFLPVDGTVGTLRSAPIRSDGSFEADRVPVGWNQIGLVNAPVAAGLLQEFHPLGSPIRRNIPAGGGSIAIDLLVEHEKQRAAASKP